YLRRLAAASWPIRVLSPCELPGGSCSPVGYGLSIVLYGVSPPSSVVTMGVLIAHAGARVSPVTSVIAAGIQNRPYPLRITVRGVSWYAKPKRGPNCRL